MTQHPEYRFHRGIPVAVQPDPATPIYDQLVLERALEDQEGKDLVTAIHVRQGYLPPAMADSYAEDRARNAYAYRADLRLLGRITPPVSLVKFLGGMFR